jgi:hypothetical protein
MSQYSFSQYLIATLQLYKSCAVDAGKTLFFHWPILPLTVLLFFLFIYLQGLFGGMGIGGGFLVGFAAIVFIAYYYGWLSSALDEKKFSFESSYILDYHMFFHIMSVAFILWIADMIIGSVLKGLPVEGAGEQIYQLGLFVIFNAIPETLYIRRYESTHALGHAATFTRDNWIEWFLPFLVVLLPVALISLELLLHIVTQSMVLIPATSIVFGWMMAMPAYGNASIVLGIIVGTWYMLFRGFLFKELESGSRRQRLYRAKM